MELAQQLMDSHMRQQLVIDGKRVALEFSHADRCVASAYSQASAACTSFCTLFQHQRRVCSCSTPLSSPSPVFL